MKKDKVQIPKKEFIKEHKRLVSVLRSPSHADDKKEANKQAAELKEETQKSVSEFVKKQKMQKSLDFHTTQVGVDSKDQLLAETTASPELINYIKNFVANGLETSGLAKIPFMNGTLTLSKKEPGLFDGFFSDQDGQVVEKFDNQTVEMVAKNMELKELYRAPTSVAPPVVAEDDAEARSVVRDEAQKVIEELISAQKVKSLKVKFGDFELELRKSVKDFVNDFKKSKSFDSHLIRKAIQCWRKKHNSFLPIGNDHQAARELLASWEEYKESFNQIVYGLEQLENGDE